jgi:methionine synthase II (cobalamin-independent)
LRAAKIPDVSSIKGENDVSEDEMREQAMWEVFFTRISGVQEFGWHASIESLKYPMTELHEYIGDKWEKLKPALRGAKQSWTETIIELAKSEGRFFPRHSDGARW